MENIERRRKAEEFKKLYNYASNSISNKQSMEGQSFGDWSFQTQTHDKKSNYKAAVFKNDKTNEVVILNMGTDFKNRKDIMDDIKMAFNRPPRQFDEASKYHDQIARQYAGHKINVAGHSEGGSESQYVGSKNPSTDAYTFNAYGIGRMRDIKNSGSDHSNIFNFRDPQDPVSKLGRNIGNEYIVPVGDDTKRKPSVFGYKEAHQIGNMGDINNAVTPDEYKKRKNNLGFVGSMDNVLLTNEDIGAMDRFTFDVYSPLIDKRLKERRIMPRSVANYHVSNGGGLTFVNGYTRSDGVQVPGHYRMT